MEKAPLLSTPSLKKKCGSAQCATLRPWQLTLFVCCAVAMIPNFLTHQITLPTFPNFSFFFRAFFFSNFRAPDVFAICVRQRRRTKKSSGVHSAIHQRLWHVQADLVVDRGHIFLQRLGAFGCGVQYPICTANPGPMLGYKFCTFFSGELTTNIC